MAKYIPGQLGRIEGKLGELVLYQRRGIPVVKRRPEKRRLKASASQLLQREKFILATCFFSQVKEAVLLGYRERKTSMTVQNRAMGNFLRNTCQQTNGDVRINYAGVIMADGELDGLYESQAVSLESNTIQITWLEQRYLRSGVSGEDQVCLLFYNQEKEIFYLKESAGKRMDCKLSLQLPEFMSDLDFHLWVFVISGIGKDVSSSLYMGKYYIIR
ncbi:DUF6266 family protein [Pedobacter antarcticus]|uniref:DUF6266 family protein n=1 Tax=Pedobacter antarcticus TaxID=34086 RepID=UPI001C5760EA|nr:DUF6266 family protein [Pedobacter antarcticus]